MPPSDIPMARPSNELPSLDWLLVATKPRSELIARANLERQGYTVCLPTLTRRKRRRGKWQAVTEPMFPGYLFVGVALGADDIAPIRSTLGCLQPVRFGGRLIPLPRTVMEALLGFDSEPMVAIPRFMLGERLRIEEGPFAGLEAVFEMPQGEDRAQVLIEMLGRARSVVIKQAHLNTT